MYIRRILILTAAIGLIFMGSFAFYVYKVMFMSNTSFEGDFEYIFIKSDTSYDQFLNQLDSYLLSVDDFNVLAKRKKYGVRPGKYRINKGMSNNDIINTLRSNNITVNVIYNNVNDLNDLAGKISNQIEADSISFLNSFKTGFFTEKDLTNKTSYQCIFPIVIIFSGIPVLKSLTRECLRSTQNFGKRTTGLKKQIKLDYQK